MTSVECSREFSILKIFILESESFFFSLSPFFVIEVNIRSLKHHTGLANVSMNLYVEIIRVNTCSYSSLIVLGSS